MNITHPTIDHRTTTHVRNSSAYSNVELGGSSSNKHAGFYLRWSRLCKEVEVPSRSAGLMAKATIGCKRIGNNDTKARVILDQVSGYAAPGELLCCMGPSGSGKTSLMNALSGRGTFQSGTLSINGEPMTRRTMKRLMGKIAYVRQQDVFFEHLSVRDQLTYAALLRLPSNSMSTKDKHDLVARVIQLLSLGNVAESPIELISGGEKKRVSIGTELLTDPSCLLLDEPTSGLDSTRAVSLIDILKHLANDLGKTVITVVHQPSSALFHSLDRLLYLSEGKVVYFGTPEDSLTYLNNHGLGCPASYNVADHWMDLLVKDSTEQEEPANADGSPVGQRSTSNKPPRFLLQRAWDNEAVAKQMDQAVAAANMLDYSGNNRSGLDLLGKKYHTGWTTQFLVLTHRALKNAGSAVLTPTNLLKSIAVAFLCGILWFRTDYTEKSASDIRGLLFSCATYWFIDSVFSAVALFPAERRVITKERASASYHLSAYFAAKLASDAPSRLILPLLYMSVSYWMAGIDNRFWVFLAVTGNTLLGVLTGDALGMLLGAILYDAEVAAAVAWVLIMVLVLLGGFFVSVPFWLEWPQFLNPFKYTFDASMQIIFDRPIPCDGSGALGPLCAGSSAGYVSGSTVQEFFGVRGSVAFNVGISLLFGLIPRFAAYLALRTKKGGEHS